MLVDLQWHAIDTGSGEYAQAGNLCAIFWREGNAPTAGLGWRVKLLRDNGLGYIVVNDGHAKNELAAKSLAASFLMDARPK